MVVNTFVNFLDVYAIGFGSAMLFARAEAVLQARRETKPEERRTRLLREAAATVVFAGCLVGICELLKVQSATNGQADLQGHQMIFRPLFALGFAGLILSAPFSLKFLRFLLGNRVTAFLSAISMNYYLVHQTEQPWQTQYTWAAFGFSLILAVLITFLVEKPAGKLLQKLYDRKKAAPGGTRSQHG